MTRSELFASMRQLVDSGVIKATCNVANDSWQVSFMDPATGGLASPKTMAVMEAVALSRLSQHTERN